MEPKSLTKEQVRGILDNAPANLDKKVILQTLVQKGFQLEGFSATPKPPVVETKPTFQEASAETTADIKQIGTDVKSSLAERNKKIEENKARQAEGTQGSFRTGIQNLGQVLGFGADVIADTVKGGVKALLPQKNEDKVKENLALLYNNPIVKPIVDSVPAQELASRFRQWKIDNPEKAADVDAAAAFLEFASNFVGAEALGAGGKVASDVVEEGLTQGAKQTARLAKTAANAAVDATNAVGEATSGLKSTLKSAAGDIIPTSDRIVNEQVTRALDLTQGDVKNIAKATGNEVGQFLGEKNLIMDNVPKTKEAVDSFWKTKRAKVLEEVSKVQKVYDTSEIPRYKDALKAIKQKIDGVVGLESDNKLVNDLLKKKKIVLSDVQNVKELMDDHLKLYKITGDVAETVEAKGFANVRRDLKNFVEDEVAGAGGLDIKELNNEVATARNISNAIEARATRGLTRSNLKLGDLATFGGVSAILSPIGGLVAVGLKKVVESPAFRLRLAKFLDSISDARKAKIITQLNNEVLPKEIESLIQPQSIKNTTKQTRNSSAAAISEVSNTKSTKSTVPKITVDKTITSFQSGKLTENEFSKYLTAKYPNLGPILAEEIASQAKAIQEAGESVADFLKNNNDIKKSLK